MISTFPIHYLRSCNSLHLPAHGNDSVADLKMIENNFAKDCYWMYDEIYLADGGFEFHISIDGENGYDYITLKASDVEFE